MRDNPKKGSSLAAIKGFMAEEWAINVQVLKNIVELMKRFDSFP